MCQLWTEEKVKQRRMTECDKDVAPVAGQAAHFLLAPVPIPCGGCCGEAWSGGGAVQGSGVVALQVHGIKQLPSCCFLVGWCFLSFWASPVAACSEIFHGIIIVGKGL